MKGCNVSSDPNEDHESPSHIRERLAELDDPEYSAAVAKATAFFADLEEAAAYHADLRDSKTNGITSEILLKKVEVPAAKRLLAELEARQLVLRGDYLDESPAVTKGAETPGPPGGQAARPTALTTGDIAHSFAGLRWPVSAD